MQLSIKFHYAGTSYTERSFLTVMLSVIMVNVVALNVVMPLLLLSKVFQNNALLM
jgi:hypothetical protein